MDIHTDQRGFSLIELLVAVAVLSVVTAIAVPSYLGYVRNSKMVQCQKEVATLKLAEENFFSSPGNNTFFAGNGVAAIQLASGGWYTPSSDVTAANTNCSFNIVAGTTGNISSSYSIRVTGLNDLASLAQPIITYNGP